MLVGAVPVHCLGLAYTSGFRPTFNLVVFLYMIGFNSSDAFMYEL